MELSFEEIKSSREDGEKKCQIICTISIVGLKLMTEYDENKSRKRERERNEKIIKMHMSRQDYQEPVYRPIVWHKVDKSWHVEKNPASGGGSKTNRQYVFSSPCRVKKRLLQTSVAHVISYSLRLYYNIAGNTFIVVVASSMAPHYLTSMAGCFLLKYSDRGIIT